MPSPFPGMDPYLEAPDIWPDFHDALAGEIRAVLNQTLPPPYYARLEMRPELGIVVDEGMVSRRIVPDVAVARSPGKPPDPGRVAVLDGPRTEISESSTVTVSSEPLRHAFVEIRDPARGHELITLLEIVSPNNKQGGPDREAYLRKQQEVLESTANLMELDLLRAGTRLVTNHELIMHIAMAGAQPDYLVLINRSWARKGHWSDYQVFRAVLTSMLPVIPVPLREGQKEVPLDLQYVLNRAYDNGPYRRGAVDYTQPPQPPLPDTLTTWAAGRLRAAGLVSDSERPT
jgi:Protein of unknown function (DUF4058)